MKPLLLITLLSMFAWAPLLTPAYFLEAHDARHSLFYLTQFDQTLRDGYLWPRWSPDFAFGYGYPLFNLYAPLAVYAAELLHLAGLSKLNAIKAMYLLATIAGGWGMYGFVRHLFGQAGGLLAAIVYIYAPFHLVDLYVRSAYAEFVALNLIPFVFWAFTLLIEHPSRRHLALAGLSYGLLALTHHTSFFTFTPFLMLYILYQLLATTINETGRFSLIGLLRRAVSPLLGGLLGVALAAIYLIPALTETRYIKVEQWTSGSYNYLDHFVYLFQFLSPTWGYGYAGIGLRDEFSYQLGIVTLSLTSFALVHSLTQPLRGRSTALFFYLATLSTILLMTPLAEPIWQIVPLATLVQFPWRLLGVTAFTMAVVSGALLARPDHLPKPVNTDTFLIIPLLLVVILASHPYTLPQYTAVPLAAQTPLAVINWDSESPTDRVGMVAVTDEQPTSSPMLEQYRTGQPLQVAGIIDGAGTVETLHHGGASSTVFVQADGAVTVQFYTYDFPGWRVTRNGQAFIEHRPEPPYGLITVDLPAGEHTLHLRMGSTPPRTLGTVISGMAVAVMVGLGLSFGRKKE